MRAWMCSDLDGPDALGLEHRPQPEPGVGEIRIRVEAAGVNYADLLMVQGRYQERPALPFTPGLECAGRIEAIGPDVAGPAPGQRVIALLDHGAFAEQTLARASDVVPIEEAVDPATAAGIPIAYGTAQGALVWRAGLRPGEVLLVHGAAGGVGLAAVECGRVLGARVIAVARGERRLEVARAHGAEHTIDSEAPDLSDQLKELAPDGIDVTLDPVGGRLFDLALRRSAWGARLVIVGFAGGAVPQIPANLLLVKNAAALGFWWGSYRRRDPARLREGLLTVLSWLESGRIRPHIETVPFARADEALRLLSARRVTGKLVVTMDG